MAVRVAASKRVTVSLLTLLVVASVSSCNPFEESPPGYELDEDEIGGLSDCVRKKLEIIRELEGTEDYIKALGKVHHLLKLTSAGKRIPGPAGEVLSEVNGATKFRIYGPTGKESIRGMGMIAGHEFDHLIEQELEWALADCNRVNLCSKDDEDGVMLRAAMLANGQETGCAADDPVGPTTYNFEFVCTEGESFTGLHSWFFEAMSQECTNTVTTSYG